MRPTASSPVRPARLPRVDDALNERDPQLYSALAELALLEAMHRRRWALNWSITLGALPPAVALIWHLTTLAS